MTFWDFVDRHPFWTLVGFLPLWLLLRSVALALRRGPVLVKAEVRVREIGEGDPDEGDEEEVDPPLQTKPPEGKIPVVGQKN